MIDIEDLFGKYSEHVSSLKAAPFICNIHAAFESWFHVELVPVLWELGIADSSIEPRYAYPNSSGSADLGIRTREGVIVFELKSFVSDKSGKKEGKYPNQIGKLAKLVSDRDALQAIAFTTFIGYSKGSMMNHVKKFFKKGPWDVIGPTRLVEPYGLHLCIASMTS